MRCERIGCDECLTWFAEEAPGSGVLPVHSRFVMSGEYKTGVREYCPDSGNKGRTDPRKSQSESSGISV